MPTMDQVVWASVNLHAGGEPQNYKRGDLLPEPASDEESAQRMLLRQGGALRVVEVVYTAEELAEQARARGEVTSRRESALDVDPAVPLGDQQAGQMEPGLPTLVEPSGSPVVIGDEDLRAEHEKMRAGDSGGDADAGRTPPPSATKAAWVEHVVHAHGVARDEAEGMTKDQLAERYGGGTGSGEGERTGNRAADRDPGEEQAAGAEQGTTAPQAQARQARTDRDQAQARQAAARGPQPQAAPQPPPSSKTDSPGPQPPQPGASRGGKQGS